MQQRLSFITIGVTDLERMKKFYHDVFGWIPIKDSDGIVFFKLNGFILGLYPKDELAEDIGVSNESSGFKAMSFAFNLGSEAEVDALFRDLTGKGAIAVKQPEKVFWGGYRGYIADPERHYWEIAYNPFLKMDAAGNVFSHD